MLGFLRRSSVNCRVNRYFSSDVGAKFLQAQQAINNPANKRDVSNDIKLKLYGLFKQAETGPCTTSRPGIFDPVGRAKYDSWHGLGNMPKEEAQQKYVDTVTSIFDGKLPDAPSQPAAAPKATASKPEGKVQAEATLESVAFPKRQKLNLADLHLETVDAGIDSKGVVSVQLNRPNKGNSFNIKMWNDFREVFQAIEKVDNNRVVILSGKNSNFSTGMDVSVFMELNKIVMKEDCDGRRREGVYNSIQFLQDAISAPENCSAPVIAAVAGNCIGGAIDLISACDLRYCTKDASFCIKETDFAIVADIGTLQRLPKIIGNQATAELTYTGRTFNGTEAAAMGLVLKCFDTEEEMMKHVHSVAEQIAAKSPITIRGVKKTILYQRDHSVQDALHQVKLWNSAFLFGDDLLEATSSMMSKKPPVFKG